MNVLIVGSGGRECAIYNALNRSGFAVRVYSVGEWQNPGMSGLQVMDIRDNDSIVSWAIEREISIAVIGSENQLEQGLADAFTTAGIFCVGPSKDLARIETNKIFARKIIPDRYNPRYKVFDCESYSQEALEEYLRELNYNYVIKAVGLRGGKGVQVSGVHLTNTEQAHKFCERLVIEDTWVLVEERLFGEEFTLMAFTDGDVLVHMPVVKDYKRRDDGDQGPNTGGMGCVSFTGGGAPFLSDSDLETAKGINRVVLSKVQGNVPLVKGPRPSAVGTDAITDRFSLYVGVLYGSFIKTDNGVKVIEYNCRFGDPESINVLELLETDLLQVFIAMREKRLRRLPVAWSTDAIVTNYIVQAGYPGANNPKPAAIKIPDTVAGSVVFAKVIKNPDRYMEYTQMGSRSIAVFSRGITLEKAYQRNLALLRQFSGDIHYRTDIGFWAVQEPVVKRTRVVPVEQPLPPTSYAASGVDIAEGERVVEKIRDDVVSTWNDHVVSDFGDFAGMYCLNRTTLVTSTDGVGTKTIAVLKVLGDAGFESLGHDIVNHCVNDILVKGGRPLFFLDYIASSKLNADHVARFVSGVAAACRTVECALIGGETAEMPDVYNSGHVDIVGTIVGFLKNAIDGTIFHGDHVIGLRSSGPHTNGYSLIRKVIKDLKPADVAPHRCYMRDIDMIESAGIPIGGLCHITGGGWMGNIKRVLPDGLSVELHVPRPGAESIFTRVQQAAGISDAEMLRTFNMGFGMLVFVDADNAQQVLELFERGYAIDLGTVRHTDSPSVIELY